MIKNEGQGQRNAIHSSCDALLGCFSWCTYLRRFREYQMDPSTEVLLARKHTPTAYV